MSACVSKTLLKLISTGLPSNLRPTIREGTSGRVIKMAVTRFDAAYQKPHTAHKLHGSKCHGSGIIADRNFTLRE